MGIQRKSLVEVKAELSRYVDDAEHRGKVIMITRHGKDAAMIVPVPAVVRPKLTRKAIDAMWATLAASDNGDPSYSAVDDLIAGRR